jgi:hypothetical protein
MPARSIANGSLHAPLYTVREAGRLLSLQPSRVKRWLLGYQYEYGPLGARQGFIALPSLRERVGRARTPRAS